MISAQNGAVAPRFVRDDRTTGERGEILADSKSDVFVHPGGEICAYQRGEMFARSGSRCLCIRKARFGAYAAHLEQNLKGGQRVWVQ